MPTIYLDACCLSRAFDDYRIARNLEEAKATFAVRMLALRGDVEWLDSEVLEVELDRNRDEEQRRKLRWLRGAASRKIEVEESIRTRARDFQSEGLKLFDAYHLACAEAGRVETFITVDDRLARAIRTKPKLSVVNVSNPIDYPRPSWVNE